MNWSPRTLRVLMFWHNWRRGVWGARRLHATHLERFHDDSTSDIAHTLHHGGMPTEKLFTQAEVDVMIGDRLARERRKNNPIKMTPVTGHKGH